jgi:hypothetical protein
MTTVRAAWLPSGQLATYPVAISDEAASVSRAIHPLAQIRE